MTELLLPALEGTNPLGYLAALGALDSMARAGRAATLRWTDDLIPQAWLAGAEDLDDLLDVLGRDRSAWAHSVVLSFPRPLPLPDAKPDNGTLREWHEAALEADTNGVDADLLSALVAEGALDGNKKAKPTHLHFTAGRQQFLEMVRELAANVDKQLLRAAICGPWAYDSPLPSLSWDSRGERIYAVRATNPQDDKRLGVPGADWLAFRGLVFYPVSLINGSLQTTACDRAWKSSAFRWPLWVVPASRDVVRSLVADERLVSQDGMPGRNLPRPSELRARGLLCILESPIRRNDRGGYGSFGGPRTLAAAGWSPERSEVR